MKRFIALMITGMMSASMVACAANNNAAADNAKPEAEATEAAAEPTEEPKEEKAEAGLANPWSDITEEEAMEIIGYTMKAPKGASNVVWSKMEDKDAELVQLTFDLDGMTFTARVKAVEDENEDISGCNYEWTVEDEVTLANWGEGNMPGKVCRYIGDDETVDLCTWYDIETGNSYSLSVSAKDLDGFDIQAVAESLYAEDTTMDGMEEGEASEDHTEIVDITGCESLDQIIEKLPEGSAYSKGKISDKDVLFVAEEVYDLDLEDKESLGAIDADIYLISEDGAPVHADYVSAGGTAYPLTIADKKLYVAGPHFIRRMILEDDKMLIEEEVYIEYDENGNPTYGLYSDTEEVKEPLLEDDSRYDALNDEFFGGEKVIFSKVAK
ncbi:MAG: hypothetical protein K5931_11260 [Lachnospiraceae bacterium]|nr:hypothetical protein [Lachnospiraceae bacterium]